MGRGEGRKGERKREGGGGRGAKRRIDGKGKGRGELVDICRTGMGTFASCHVTVVVIYMLVHSLLFLPPC